MRWTLSALRAGGMEFLKAVVLVGWAVATGVLRLRDVRIWSFVDEHDHVLHHSVVTPTAMHLPWLEKPGREIGGCFTVAAARGMKIYPFVLRSVAAQDDEPLYMIVEAGNQASRSGMERAGFQVITKLTRRSGSIRPPRYIEEPENGTDVTMGI